MNKIIICLLLVFVNGLSFESLDISKLSNENSVMSNLYCLEDKDNTFSFDTILKNTSFKKMEKSNLGYNFNSYWCKLKIHNSSLETKNLVYYNPRPGIDYIDVRIYHNDKIRDLQLGDMRPLKNRDLDSIVSNFTLSLQSNETATIVSRYQNIGNMEISWEIKNIKEFISSQNLNFTLMFIYIGFMIAMMIDKLFNFYYLRDKINLIYALFVFSAIMANVSAIGSLHYYFSEFIDLYTVTILGPIFSHLFLTSLWIFTLHFFHIDKKSRFYYPFILIILYNIVVTLLYVYSYIDISTLEITPFVVIIALVESLLLLVFSFIMFFKKKPGSFLFLIAHLFYIGSVLYYILNLTGAEFGPIKSMFISTLGIFFATYFMSLSLSSKFKISKQENNKIKKQLEKNRQFIMIGTIISYVTHQWKQPLSILGSQVTSILATIDNEPNLKVKELENKMLKVEKSVTDVNETLSNIKSIYTQKDIKTNFDLESLLSNIELGLKNQLKEKDIIFIVNKKSKNSLLYGNKNLLSHALYNIVQNSIEAFDKSITNKTIDIDINKDKNDFLSITISDNAGGIETKNLNSIFDPTLSTKTDGTGIGLAFTKNIIESKFQGTINVKRLGEGTQFDIRIK